MISEDYIQTLGVNFMEKAISIRNTEITFSVSPGSATALTSRSGILEASENSSRCCRWSATTQWPSCSCLT